MVDIAEIRLMKVSGASDGTDTYKGVRAAAYRENPLDYYPDREEGELSPSAFEPIETDRPPVEGTLAFSSDAARAALVGQQFASFTITGKDLKSGNNKTITFTNMSFLGSDGGIQNRQVQGFTLSFRATAVATT